MAEWTDEIPQFSPYVSQQPVEAMAKLGFMREQQFEAGVQTVQNYYDSLLSLPLAKREVQDYVKQKVGQLNSAVKQSISGDFSDRRLVNQIGGLASQISSDPIVKEGIESTARIQSGLAKQKADQEANAKNGKNPVNNINDFNDQINAYLSDGQNNTSFNGSYTPYVDVMDRTLAYYKELNNGQTMAADAIRWNPKTNGYEVNEVLYDGVDAQRIQNVLDIVYSQPDVQAQINVDGRQKFKGMDPIAMSAYMEKTTNRQLDGINSAIRELQIKAVTDKSADREGIDNNIKFLKSKGDNIVKRFDSASETLLGDNPDSLKSQLVWDDFTSSFTNAYTHNVMKKSPMFDAFMEKERLNDARSKTLWDIEKDKFDMSMRTKEYDLSVQKELIKGRENSPIASVTPLSVDNQQANLGMESAETDLENTRLAYADATNSLVQSVAMSGSTPNGQQKIPPPYIYRDDLGTWAPNIKGIKEYYKNPNMSPEEAEAKAKDLKNQMLSRAADDYNNGRMSPTLLPNYEKQLDVWYRLKDKERIAEAAEAEIAPYKEKIKSKIGNEDFFSLYSIQKGLPGAEIEARRLVNKYGGQYSKKYGEELKNVLMSSAVGAEALGLKGSLDKILSSVGVNPSDYYKAIKNIDEGEAKDYLNAREAAYKRQQYTLNSNKVTFDISKPEKRKSILGRMSSLATEPSLLGGNASGDYKDFLKQTDEAKYGEFTTLEAYYDSYKEVGVIRGFKGKKEYEFEVPKAALTNVFPELVAENTFLKYEQRMRYAQEMGRGRTTDVSNNGGEGYQVYHPVYDVRYHVVDLGGSYNILYYIKDRTGKTIVDGESLSIPVDKASVETLVNNNLKNQEFINKTVERKTVDNELKSLGK